MPTPTFQLLIRATGETRLIYAEHERSLFDAIRQRTGLDEAIARGILARQRGSTKRDIAPWTVSRSSPRASTRRGKLWPSPRSGPASKRPSRNCASRLAGAVAND